MNKLISFANCLEKTALSQATILSAAKKRGLNIGTGDVGRVANYSNALDRSVDSEVAKKMKYFKGVPFSNKIEGAIRNSITDGLSSSERILGTKNTKILAKGSAKSSGSTMLRAFSGAFA